MNSNDSALDISRWKKFRISEYFRIKGSRYHNPKKYEDGDIPYISRTIFNNGEAKRVMTSEELYGANCITIGAESAKAFYQENEFITSRAIHRIYVLEEKSRMNKYIGLFICTLLNRECKKYTYTNACILDKIKNTEIRLPAKNDLPDWDFMEKYAKEIYEKTQSLFRVLKNIYEIPIISNLDVSRWRKFSISEVFEIKTGAYVKKENLTAGDIPRISAANTNDGIISYYSDSGDPKYRTEENFISLSFLCTCFYHPYRASLDAKVHSLKPKGYELNRYSGLFMVTILRKMFDKASYGNQMSSSGLKKEKILLPEKNGKPDWNYMSMVGQPFYEKLQLLVRWFDNLHLYTLESS